MPKKIKMGRGKLVIKVAARIRASQQDCFDAFADTKKFNKFFTDGATGKIDESLKPVTWRWKGDGSEKLYPIEVVPGKKIVFHWLAYKVKYHTTVTLELKREKGKTLVTLEERGWNKADAQWALDHCNGWTIMLCNMKAWLRHGIDLRK